MRIVVISPIVVPLLTLMNILRRREENFIQVYVTRREIYAPPKALIEGILNKITRIDLCYRCCFLRIKHFVWKHAELIWNFLRFVPILDASVGYY